jgi:hypothetical protein
MSVRGWVCAIGVLFLVFLNPVARADIRNGFGTETVTYYPIDTYFSDSRYQFIIPNDELRIETGEILSGLRLNMHQSAGYTFTLNIRVKQASQTDLDSMALGRFVNGGLTTIRSQPSSISSTPGWKDFYTTDYSLSSTGYLLVDLVMDKSTSGADTYWRMVPCTLPSVSFGAHSTAPAFNLLNTNTPGQTESRRPIVELIGPSRRMPPVVASAAQLQDPSGRIDADWKVTGRSCTIQPGVTLNFGPDFGLRVLHNLIALGTDQDSIRFTGENWEGIVADPVAGTRVRMDRCVIDQPRNNGTALLVAGGNTALTCELRNLSIRNGDQGTGIEVLYGNMLLDGITVEGYDRGIRCMFLQHLTLENFVSRGNAEAGVQLLSCTLDGTSRIRNGLVAGNGDYGVSVSITDAILERVTVVDTGGYGLYSAFGNLTELVNCVLYNPLAEYEIFSSWVSTTVASYSTVVGGMSRCLQASSGVLVLGTQVLTGDPQLDVTYHPLSGSPVIDAGSPLTDLDPDLTVADQGCYFLDQRAPLVLSAVDVPEDQGGRLQLVWNASSMDLAQASDEWFYSVWRLDPLFNTNRSALPVVHSRRAAEEAIAEGRPFTWQRDGAAWNWLGSVPAAQFAQYALVVETLADRLEGLPLETPLKVLWHAGAVLAESGMVFGTSVDNVPPDAPLAVATVPSGSGTLRLAWQPVNTGTVNGQALAERNGVVYHVYEIPAPYAPAGSGTFLGTVSEPEFLLPLPTTASQRFFRVKADDQP